MATMASGSLPATEILTDWSVCGVEPGSAATPAALREMPRAWLPATCPGTVAAALLAAGITPDLKSTRIDAKDWWYRARFDATRSSLTQSWHLRCEGLATLAEVWLNDTQIGSASNMHVSHRFTVSGMREGDNEVLVRFMSVDAFLANRRPRPRWRVPMLAHQQLRFIRTTLLGRTPGWSPPYPAVGPWRPMALECEPESQLQHIQLRTSVDATDGIVDFSASLAQSNVDIAVTGTLNIVRHGVHHSAPIETVGNHLSARGVVRNAALWWPHTHGDPAIYDVHVELHGAMFPAGTIRIASKAVAFRTLQLSPDNTTFGLKVNGVAIFCRGACWTPLDAASLRASAGDYVRALDQVATAGMNMLRVGGTMIYEDDKFYAEASRRGILVWQDFMFANMDYPGDDLAFVAEVEHEARQFLARVASEPCIAVLCGNSEVEQQAAMWGAARVLWSPPLFHGVLPAICRELRPDVPYWPSSAHGGAFPHEPRSGTSSYYGVGAYLRPVEDAHGSGVRFATECLGVANIPEARSLATLPGGDSIRVHSPAWKARSPRDLGAGWDFDDVRDFYLKQLFAIDASALRYADHDRYMAVGRIVSGEMMVRAFAHWRRAGSACSGALVWFLRDLWAGAGWGVVAHDGVPKAAYYMVKRLLQPRTMFFTDEGVNGVDLHVVNEQSDDLIGKVTLSAYARGEVRLRAVDVPIAVPARGAQTIAISSLFDEWIDSSYAYRFGPPTVNVLGGTLFDAAGRALAESIWLPAGPLIEPGDPGITAIGRETIDGGLEVQISSKRLARYVHIEVDGATPTDNYFDLVPGSTRQVVLSATCSAGRHSGFITALNQVGSVAITWDSP